MKITIIRTVLLLASMIGAGTIQAQYLADNRVPKPVDELYRAGERAYRGGDHSTAILLFTQVLELDADHMNAYLHRGFCHSILRAYELAVADFSVLIARNPDHLWAITSRGSATAKLHRHKEAIADFDRVIALDPRNTEAFNNRGWARKALGDESGACNDWRTSKRMGNGEARIILENNRCK
jgi:tetratricopeptide (TPR) repeat protein